MTFSRPSESYLDSRAATNSPSSQFDMWDLYGGSDSRSSSAFRNFSNGREDNGMLDFGRPDGLFVGQLDFNGDGRGDMTVLGLRLNGQAGCADNLCRDLLQNLKEAWQLARVDGDLSDLGGLFVRGLLDDLLHRDRNGGNQNPDGDRYPDGDRDRNQPPNNDNGSDFGEPVDYQTYAREYKPYQPERNWAAVPNTHNGETMGYMAPGETYEEFFTGKSGHINPKWLRPIGSDPSTGQPISEAEYILKYQIPKQHWGSTVYQWRP